MDFGATGRAQPGYHMLAHSLFSESLFGWSLLFLQGCLQLVMIVPEFLCRQKEE